MSFLVAHMQKSKSGNLGLDKHIFRKTENHTNKEIDNSRSYLNYNLIEKYNSQKDIIDYINKNKSTKKAVRKDAVVLNNWIISSDQDFFKDKTNEEIKKFFSTSLDFFKNKFGSENIMYCQIHLDETTPHAHIGIVPFTNDFRLSSKEVFNRQTLKYIQEQLPKELKEKGFDIERGVEGSENVHLDTPEFKATMKELNRLREENEKLLELNKSLLNSRECIDPKVLEKELKGIEKRVKKALFGDGVILQKNDYTRLLEHSVSGMVLEKNLDFLDSMDYRKINSKIKNLDNREKEIKKKEKELKIENEKLDKTIDSVNIQIRSKFSEIESEEERLNKLKKELEIQKDDLEWEKSEIKTEKARWKFDAIREIEDEREKLTEEHKKLDKRKENFFREQAKDCIEKENYLVEKLIKLENNFTNLENRVSPLRNDVERLEREKKILEKMSKKLKEEISKEHELDIDDINTRVHDEIINNIYDIEL